jgi:hypothetical protein
MESREATELLRDHFTQENLAAGTSIEVRDRFRGQWSRGAAK